MPPPPGLPAQPSCSRPHAANSTSGSIQIAIDKHLVVPAPGLPPPAPPLPPPPPCEPGSLTLVGIPGQTAAALEVCLDGRPSRFCGMADCIAPVACEAALAVICEELGY